MTLGNSHVGRDSKTDSDPGKSSSKCFCSAISRGGKTSSVELRRGGHLPSPSAAAGDPSRSKDLTTAEGSLTTGTVSAVELERASLIPQWTEPLTRASRNPLPGLTGHERH